MSEEQKTEIYQAEKNVVEQSGTSRKSDGEKWGIIGGVALILIALIVGISIYDSPSNRISRQLDLGQRYLDEQNYEQAIVEFNKAIEINPMSVEAYLGLADAYIGMNDYETATEVLQKGYELTADERLKRKWESISDNNQGAKDSSTNSELIETNENEETSEIVQKLEGLASLLDDGRTENMFQFDEVNFFGHDVHNMTKEVFDTIVIEQGYKFNSFDDEEPDWSHPIGWYPSRRPQDAPSIVGRNTNDDEYFDSWSFETYTETEEHMPIGVRNIYTYDTLENVLAEFGFSNGKEISDYINEFFTMKGHSVDIFHGDIGTTLYEVAIFNYGNNGEYLYFDFTGLTDIQNKIEYDYSNGTISKVGEEKENNIDTFNCFELKFGYSDGFIWLRFNQVDGQFIYLDESMFFINED